MQHKSKEVILLRVVRSHCRTVALSHCRTVALSHCRTVALSLGQPSDDYSYFATVGVLFKP